MINFLPLTIESKIDWTILLAILAALAYYFGKLMSEVSPNKEDKYTIYTLGVNYLALFVVFPPLILYTLSEYNISYFRLWWAISLQFILTSFLGLKLKAYIASRLHLEEFVNNITDAKTKKVYEDLNINQKADTSFALRIYNTIFFKRWPFIILLLCALLTYWFTASILFLNAKPLFIFISLLFLWSSLSILAIFFAYRNAKYPDVMIQFEDGEKLNGQLTKIEDGYINIINGNKIYNISDSKVKYIQIEVLKKEGIKRIKKMKLFSIKPVKNIKRK